MARFNVGKIDRFISRAPFFNIIYKSLIQKTINYDFPTHLFIESTSICNFHCQICPRTHGDTLLGNMNFSLFKKIIDEAKSYGPRNFCLHLFGEPLMAPQIIEMIKYIKESNSDNAILLTTNGVLLDAEKSEALVKYQTDKISISFTSPNKKTYFEKTGADKLEVVEKNIERLVEIKKRAGSRKPLIFVRMIADQETKSQIGEFLKRWRKRGVIPEIREMYNYGGNIKKDDINKTKKRYPCYHLWLSPAIHWNGDFSLCCADYGRKLLLGNVKNQTINQIWTSKKVKHYRQLHLQGKYDQIPGCKDCDTWNVYSDLFFQWQKK